MDFTRRAERLAWSLGCPPLVLLSGGECGEHPDIVRLVETVIGQGMDPVLITNGMWLGNRELREALLRPEWTRLMVQVTNDSRFYPSAPERIDDPRVAYVDSLTLLMPLGRMEETKGQAVERGKGAGRTVPFLLVLSVIYLGLLRLVGFWIDTFLLMPVLYLLSGGKSPVRSILFSIITIMVSYIIFTVLLRVEFPPGLVFEVIPWR